MLKKFYLKLFFLIIFISLTIIGGGYLQAATSDELQQKISNSQAEIKKLDAEIAKYREQIGQTSAEKASLAKEIARLELARKKLQADIAVTQNKISITDNKIKTLDQGIKTTVEKISDDQKALSDTLRQINNYEQADFVENIIGQNSLSELWINLSRYESLSRGVETTIGNLRINQQELQGNKKQKESEKTQLSNLQSELLDQKKITENTKQTKNDLLAVTKNKEANYQKLLADRLKKKQQVESEIAQAEAALRYTANPNNLPHPGSGVLAWPLNKVKITQGFGNTDFAKSNKGIYNGKGHNGIDLGASIGDQLMSAGEGTVLGAGDTDLTCRGASYGKWVLIGYDNGLASIYGHLSAIKVKEGQRVSTGQLVGYTGSTGYSTGPHLHFSVLAKEAVQVGSLKSKVPGCGTYRLPMAAFSAYLNPLNYL